MRRGAKELYGPVLLGQGRAELSMARRRQSGVANSAAKEKWSGVA